MWPFYSCDGGRRKDKGERRDITVDGAGMDSRRFRRSTVFFAAIFAPIVTRGEQMGEKRDEQAGL